MSTYLFVFIFLASQLYITMGTKQMLCTHTEVHVIKMLIKHCFVYGEMHLFHNTTGCTYNYKPSDIIIILGVPTQTAIADANCCINRGDASSFSCFFNCYTLENIAQNSIFTKLLMFSHASDRCLFANYSLRITCLGLFYTHPNLTLW